MSAAVEAPAKPVLVGRSSSHFTRVTRIFAAELGAEYSFQVVRDLMSCDPQDYGGNPALKLPTLRTADGDWYGALPICRALWRGQGRPAHVVWPEDLEAPLLANYQELVVQAMTTEVILVLATLAGGGDTYRNKLRTSLLGTMAWLETHATAAIAALPADRTLSFLEVTLLCLVTHLEFRDVVPTTPYPRLGEFCQQFSARPSIAATPYHFDP